MSTKPQEKIPAPQLLQAFMAKNKIIIDVKPVLVQRDDGHWDIQIQAVVDYNDAQPSS